MAEKKEKRVALVTDELTEVDKKFIDEYMINGFNGSAAIMVAHAGKYKKSSSFVAASRTLKKANVKAEVKRRMDDLSERTKVKQEMIIAELLSIAFFDIRKLFDKNNDLRNISELDDDSAKAISQINIEVDQFGHKVSVTTKKIKLNDKIAALKLLGMNIGMFREGDENNDENLINALKLIAKSLPN